MLTALAEAISAWTRRKLTLIVLERRGRVDLFEGVDLSRTMGWFTTTHPALLRLPDHPDPGAHDSPIATAANNIAKSPSERRPRAIKKTCWT